MYTATNAKENTTLEVTASITPSTSWRLAAIEVQAGFCLNVQFNDGTEGHVDMAGLVNSPNAGVFAVLRDEAIFRQVYLQWGVATWPGEIDLAPDAMYEAIRQHGKWVLS